MRVKAALATMACVAVVGCGGGSHNESATAGGYGGLERNESYGGEMVAEESMGMSMSYNASAESDGDYAMDAAPTPSAARPMMAQAEAAPRMAPGSPSGASMPIPPPAPQPPGHTPQPPPVQSDATPDATPLLIYEATLHLAVFKVEENLKAIAAMAKEHGGFMAQQTTNMIVIRVPVAKFHSIVEKIEESGDVLGRQVQATDVSEEFRDVEIRLRNAIAVRERIVQLLARAEKVQDSLQIERELERITGEIERMKGRLTYLQDRIAYSTITVSFRPKEQEHIDNNMFRLPFQWLDSLGLQRLLQL